MPRKQVLVQLDDDLVERLDRLARRMEVSRSELLRRGALAVLEADRLDEAERELVASYERHSLRTRSWWRRFGASPRRRHPSGSPQRDLWGGAARPPRPPVALPSRGLQAGAEQPLDCEASVPSIRGEDALLSRVTAMSAGTRPIVEHLGAERGGCRPGGTADRHHGSVTRRWVSKPHLPLPTPRVSAMASVAQATT